MATIHASEMAAQVKVFRNGAGPSPDEIGDGVRELLAKGYVRRCPLRGEHADDCLEILDPPVKPTEAGS